MIKKLRLRFAASRSPITLKTKKKRMADDFSSLPEAKGLLDLSGWCLSSSRSFKSLRIYSDPDSKQKTINARTVFRMREKSRKF
jgi:hypothetical protein